MVHRAEVSALIRRRIDRLRAENLGSRARDRAQDDVAGMIDQLAKWSPTEAIPPLRRYCADLMRDMHSDVDGLVVGPVGREISERIRLGDVSAAATDYVRLEPHEYPDDPFIRKEFFAPAEGTAREPRLLAVRERFRARWKADFASGKADVVSGSAINAVELSDHLLPVASFRKVLIAGLKSPVQVGTITCSPIQSGAVTMDYHLLSGSVRQEGFVATGEEKAMAGHTYSVSTADVIAVGMSRLSDGSDRSYSLAWPEAKRRAACAERIAWLQDDCHDWPRIAKALRDRTMLPPEPSRR